MISLLLEQTFIGDRDENLDRSTFYSGANWSLSLLVDGFKPIGHTLVDALIESLNTIFSSVSDSKLSCYEDLTTLVNKALMNTEGVGKASLVFALSLNDDVRIYHLGDTRAYFIDNGIRTFDHSVAQDMVNRGASPKEFISTHPYRNILNKSFDQSIKSLDSFECNLIEGNRSNILLATDGLWSLLNSDDDIYKLTSVNEVNHLFDVISTRKIGRRDNISFMYLGC